MMAEPSIALCGRSCHAIFEQLRIVWPSTNSEIMSQVSLSAIETERCRYDLWVNNIAALQDAYLPSSLEYRVRGDTNARKTIMNALIYLEESLQLALSIGSGERLNETWDEPSLSSNEANEGIGLPSSEIVELYLSIQEAITSLFKLSMIIRKKPEVDEYVKAASRYQIDPTNDIVHVADKYPTAKKHEMPWLIKRLGVAITQRRQYLIFRREHQERMLQSHKIRVSPDGNTIWSGTKASTHLPDENFTINDEDLMQPIKIAIDSSQNRPQTEYADSSRGRDGATDFLRTPLLPMRHDGTRAKYGEHFECPYCWRIQKVHDKNGWKKHVLSDLKPYVCTFQPCDLNMFESQHEWFTHELDFHREQWYCSYCEHETPKCPRSRPNLIIHLQAEHQEAFNRQSIDILLKSCQIKRIEATACPLCKEYGGNLQKSNQSPKCDVYLKQFQRHLGIHMQQLALAALPLENHEEDAEDRDDEDDESDEFRDIGQKKGIVIYDFIARADSEVTVAMDDEVIIIGDLKSEQRCRVRHQKTGKEGFIPTNYVKIISIPPNSCISGTSNGSSTTEKAAESEVEDGAEDEIREDEEIPELEDDEIPKLEDEGEDEEIPESEDDEMPKLEDEGEDKELGDVQSNKLSETGKSQKEQLFPSPPMGPFIDFQSQDGFQQAGNEKKENAAAAAVLEKWGYSDGDDEDEDEKDKGEGGNSSNRGGNASNTGDGKKGAGDEVNGDSGDTNVEEWNAPPVKSTKRGKKGKKGKVKSNTDLEPALAETSATFDEIKLDDTAPIINLEFGPHGAIYSGSGVLADIWGSSWDFSSKPLDATDAKSKDAIDAESKDTAFDDNPWSIKRGKPKKKPTLSWDQTEEEDKEKEMPEKDQKEEDDFGFNLKKGKKKRSIMFDEEESKKEESRKEEPLYPDEVLAKANDDDEWMWVPSKIKKKKGKGAGPNPVPESIVVPEIANSAVEEDDIWGSFGTMKKAKTKAKAKEKSPQPIVDTNAHLET